MSALQTPHSPAAGQAGAEHTTREIAQQLEALRLRAIKIKRARNDSARGKRIANRQRKREAPVPVQESPGHPADERRDA